MWSFDRHTRSVNGKWWYKFVLGCTRTSSWSLGLALSSGGGLNAIASTSCVYFLPWIKLITYLQHDSVKNPSAMSSSTKITLVFLIPHDWEGLKLLTYQQCRSNSTISLTCDPVQDTSQNMWGCMQNWYKQALHQNSGILRSDKLQLHIRYAGVIQLLFLIGHIFLIGTWLGVLIWWHMLKRDWSTSLNSINYSTHSIMNMVGRTFVFQWRTSTNMYF